MKKIIYVVFSLLIVLLLSGCGNKSFEAGISDDMIPGGVMDAPKKSKTMLAEENEYIPKHAFMESEQQVSKLHPNEIRKAGVSEFTIVKFRFNFGLLVLEDIIGEWPILAHLKDGREVKGYAYFKSLDNDITFWGEAVFLCSMDELKEAKILLTNRDGGFFYDLEGQEFLCDLKEFDKDMVYRQKFFDDFGSDLSVCSEEISVGSSRWKNWIAGINDEIKAGNLFPYKMANGEVRISVLPGEPFRLASTRFNDWEADERAFRRAGKIPVTIAIFTQIGVPAIMASNLIAGAMDDNREGSYARANGPRHQITPTALKLFAMIRAKLAYVSSANKVALSLQ